MPAVPSTSAASDDCGRRDRLPDNGWSLTLCLCWAAPPPVSLRATPEQLASSSVNFSHPSLIQHTLELVPHLNGSFALVANKLQVRNAAAASTMWNESGPLQMMPWISCCCT
jgi:hypothetical protein